MPLSFVRKVEITRISLQWLYDSAEARPDPADSLDESDGRAMSAADQSELDPIASTSRLPLAAAASAPTRLKVTPDCLVAEVQSPRRVATDSSLLRQARSNSPDLKGKGKALSGNDGSEHGEGSSDDGDKDDGKPSDATEAGKPGTSTDDPNEEILYKVLPKANIVGLKYARGITTRTCWMLPFPLPRQGH